jgi:uncharacterized protein (TIGR03067 family)
MKKCTLMLLVVGLLAAADRPRKEKVKKELERLQGTWVAVSVEENGRRLRPRIVRLARITLTIDGNKFSFHSPRGDAEGTLKIDPTKKPKWMDTVTEEKDKTRLGIYQLKGDTLTLCGSKERRPTEFKSARNGPKLIILKREKK